MARTTRRDLLSAGGFTMLASVAAVAIAKPDAQAVEVLPTAHADDAELVVLCRQFMALQAELDAQAQRDHVPDDELEAVVVAQGAIIDKMQLLRATTLAGYRARAVVFDKWCSRDQEGTFDLVLHWRDVGPLIRDLIGGPI